MGDLLNPFTAAVEKIQAAQTRARATMQQAETAQTGWQELAPDLRHQIVSPLRRAHARLGTELNLQAATSSRLTTRLDRQIAQLKRLPVEIALHPFIIGLRLMLWIGNRVLDVVEFVQRNWQWLLLLAAVLGFLIVLIIVIPLVVDFLRALIQNLLTLIP